MSDQINSIVWTDNTANYLDSDIIDSNTTAQLINLTPTTYVAQLYNTNYINREHVLTMFVNCNSSITNIVISITPSQTNWTKSIGKVFTINDGINTIGYKKISWTFIPPVNITNNLYHKSVFKLFIVYNLIFVLTFKS